MCACNDDDDDDDRYVCVWASACVRCVFASRVVPLTLSHTEPDTIVVAVPTKAHWKKKNSQPSEPYCAQVSKVF